MKRCAKVFAAMMAVSLLPVSASVATPAPTPLLCTEDGPCATPNPNVDCWDGIWHYNTCASTCI